MPVMDYIRARVRQPDCLWAVFPDNGGSVFSPMNNQVFPIPGSVTGHSQDINDGLLTLQRMYVKQSFSTIEGFTPSSTSLSPEDDAYIASNLDIRGMTPNHTVVMCMSGIPIDASASTSVFGFTADNPFVNWGPGITIAQSTTTLSVGIEQEKTSALEYSYNVFGTMTASSHSENSGSYDPDNLNHIKVSKTYTKTELDPIVASTSKFILAFTCDQTTRTCCLYFNGGLIGSRHGAWEEYRNELSFGVRWVKPYGTCRFGVGTTVTSGYIPSSFKIHYGAVFNTVMTPDEIKLMSEN